MGSRPLAIRKADLAVACEVTLGSGFHHMTYVVEPGDGSRHTITASRQTDADRSEMTPLKAWKAGKHGSV